MFRIINIVHMQNILTKIKQESVNEDNREVADKNSQHDMNESE